MIKVSTHGGYIFGAPTSLPANALASYLEEGDLKLKIYLLIVIFFERDLKR